MHRLSRHELRCITQAVQPAECEQLMLAFPAWTFLLRAGLLGSRLTSLICLQEELLDALQENARMTQLLNHYRADHARKRAEASKSESVQFSIDRALFRTAYPRDPTH
jgi:hypothetical protein